MPNVFQELYNIGVSLNHTPLGYLVIIMFIFLLLCIFDNIELRW